jgi:hypothetical protein
MSAERIRESVSEGQGRGSCSALEWTVAIRVIAG